MVIFICIQYILGKLPRFTRNTYTILDIREIIITLSVFDKHIIEENLLWSYYDKKKNFLVPEFN